MKQTIYSFMNTRDLLDFAQLRDNRTEMEVELAQRLEVALMRGGDDGPDPDPVVQAVRNG